MKDCGSRMSHHNNTSDILVKPKFAEFTRQVCRVNDFMFGRIIQNAEICKGFLERMLDIKIDKIEYPELQKSISPHYQSKGIRLDVYVQDSNHVFDIEIQNSLDENLPKRTLYYQFMMNVDLLLKGKNYTEVKESFVIFICKDDFFGFELPCYSFSNTCKEKSDLSLNDESHKIFFNASAFMQEKNVEKKINSRVYCR